MWPASRLATGEPVPATLTEGIVLDQVGFTYPGQGTPALSDISLTLRAGTPSPWSARTAPARPP